MSDVNASGWWILVGLGEGAPLETTTTRRVMATGQGDGTSEHLSGRTCKMLISSEKKYWFPLLPGCGCEEDLERRWIVLLSLANTEHQL